MFENLTEKLQRAFKNLRGQGKLTEEHLDAALREIREALVEGDVNVGVADELLCSRQIGNCEPVVADPATADLAVKQRAIDGTAEPRGERGYPGIVGIDAEAVKSWPWAHDSDAVVVVSNPVELPLDPKHEVGARELVIEAELSAADEAGVARPAPIQPV